MTVFWGLSFKGCHTRCRWQCVIHCIETSYKWVAKHATMQRGNSPCKYHHVQIGAGLQSRNMEGEESCFRRSLMFDRRCLDFLFHKEKETFRWSDHLIQLVITYSFWRYVSTPSLLNSGIWAEWGLKFIFIVHFLNIHSTITTYKNAGNCIRSRWILSNQNQLKSYISTIWKRFAPLEFPPLSLKINKKGTFSALICIRSIFFQKWEWWNLSHCEINESSHPTCWFCWHRQDRGSYLMVAALINIFRVTNPTKPDRPLILSYEMLLN